MDKLIKPPKLNAGDTIATISLSWGGANLYPHRYEIGKKRLIEIFGLNVIETKHSMRDPDWIYANPQARADDLMDAFSNPNIKGIFSNIGGNDAIRLLPYIDYDLFHNNPKILLGFSDTTVAHFICLKAKLTSFYGPAILTVFSENVSMHRYTVDSLKRNLFSRNIGEIQQNNEGWTAEFLDWGIAENQKILRKLNKPESWRFIQGSNLVRGRMIGGCVETLQMIMKTDLWPDLSVWDNAILFLETSEEGMPPGHFEWFLRDLGVQGILQRIVGILFSKPGGSKIKPRDFIKYDQSILSILKEYNCQNIPIVTNMDFGHTDPMMTLPYGVMVEIDVPSNKINMLESGVI